MAKGALFSALFVLFLFASPSLQFGELDVDWIIANDIAVQIEDTLVADTTVVLDFIEGLGADGVFVEQVNFNDGSVTVPVDANVGNTGTVEGALLANGGIFADSVPDGDFSFAVEDNTGDTTIKGLLSVFDGINADNGKFTVASGTGETRIADALLRADGGIDVGNGLFTVNALDGSFRTQSNANVDRDIFFGTAIAEERTLSRLPAATAFGGLTVIKGQDATSVGGDLILSPGTGATVGKLILGRASPDDLYVGRASLEDTATDGGRTVFQGQDSNSGIGGDLVVAAGDSTGTGQGGNLVLSVGLSATGNPGQLILGSDLQAESDFDLVITRPELIGSLAGSTSLNGQTTNRGAGGDLWLNAGSVLSGTGLPGDLVLQPGSTPANVVGSIFLGSQEAADLSVRRFPVAAAGGDTFIEGQTSLSGSGGDLYLRAGNAGNAGDAGNLWLEPGSTVGGQIGGIFWGQAADNLVVARPESVATGTSTTISGQDSTAGNGGDLILNSGAGTLVGGDLIVAAGSGSAGVGGSVDLTAGTGSSFGGSIQISAGDGVSGNGGDVTISAGSGVDGGSININAGTGDLGLGSVTIGPTAEAFIVNAPSVVVNDGNLVLTNGANELVINADAEDILSYNGVRVLRSRVESVALVGTPDPLICDIAIIAELQSSMNQLLNALGSSSVGHGLIEVVGQDNLAPGP